MQRSTYTVPLHLSGRARSRWAIGRVPSHQVAFPAVIFDELPLVSTGPATCSALAKMNACSLVRTVQPPML